VPEDADAALSPVRRIGDQVADALRAGREIPPRAVRDMTMEALITVGLADPERTFRAYPGELTAAARRRAAVAAAVVAEPTLLIVEEPCAGLEVTDQARMLNLFQDLQGVLGMALLVVTRDLGVVANLADEVVVLKDGRHVESGTLHDIFYQPSHPYLKGLLSSAPQFGLKPSERLNPDHAETRTPGPLLSSRPPKQAAADIFPVLDVRAVRLPKSGIGGPGVDAVSFQINRGECVALVGEKGSGKRKLMDVMLGRQGVDQGQVVFNDSGQLINLLDLTKEERAPLGQKIQTMSGRREAALEQRRTVAGWLIEPLEAAGTGDTDYRRSLCAELMDLAGLEPRFLNRYPHAFSSGERRRIAMVRALALKPELVLWDEPAMGLEAADKAWALNLIKDIRSTLGIASLFVSGDPAAAEYVADRMAVLCQGRIVEVAPSQTLFRNPVHPYTQALVTAVPYADPSRRLDFTAVDSSAANPEAWQPPFDLEGAGPLMDFGGGHLVRVARAALEG